jgi:hypothetical protein
MTMNYHFRIALNATQGQRTSLADWRDQGSQSNLVRFDDERLDDRTTRYENEESGDTTLNEERRENCTIEGPECSMCASICRPSCSPGSSKEHLALTISG